MRARNDIAWPFCLSVASAVLGVIAVLLTALMSRDPSVPLRAHYIWAEDGFVESVSAALYLAACLACLVVIARRGLVWGYVWLALSFFFLGEETSWFQRWLGYSVPLVEGSNAQGEFNFHNLEYFQRRGPPVSLSDGLAVNVRELVNSENLFRIGFTAYFLLIPILARVPAVGSMFRRIRLPLPPAHFLLCLWSTLVLSAVAALFLEQRLALSEVREMIYACFIFVYCALMASGGTRAARAERAGGPREGRAL